MFTGRMCFSLMARTTATMVCLQARKEPMMENRESISSGEVNSMKRQEPLTLRHSSKSGGSVSSGGGATVVVGSVSRQEERAERSSRRSENMIDEQRLVRV
jgi:hypothetical protein